MAIQPLLNGSRIFTNIAATPASFTLRGGLYGVTSKGTWGGGSATLQRLAFDGATYVTVLTAITADGYATVQLPPGTYRVLIATATAVYLDIIAIATDI
jgi:hypothetical protein